MPITASNPFKGQQHPGELIILRVRLYLRYPLSYEHVSELAAERGVEVDSSCIWRWVQAYAPEMNKRCRPHLKPVNPELPHEEFAHSWDQFELAAGLSWRAAETYIKVRGGWIYRTGP